MNEQEQQQVQKKVKITDFWSSVTTRKASENDIESWKLIKETVLFKKYGYEVQPDSNYSVYAFDLDNTVIATNSGRIISKDSRDWRFNMPQVPRKISELVENDHDKCIFVLFSNQLNLFSKIAERASFEAKIDNVISKLGISSKCPVFCFFSTARDIYRKPCNGLWSLLVDEYLNPKNIKLNMEKSFFVGDAAGRLADWAPGKSADWSSVDRKFALNIGLSFKTPEEFFLNSKLVEKYDIGRTPSEIEFLNEDDGYYNELLESLLENTSGSKFMIIAVGSPASGKSTFYHEHLKNRNFVQVNRDSLKTIPKCVSVVKEAFYKDQAVYIDNTNPTFESRQVFIKLAKESGAVIKCIQFTADEWLCRHLDSFRSLTKRIDPLPHVAFNTFRSRYQAPVIEEGFDSIVQIRFKAKIESDAERIIFKSYIV